MADTLMVAPDRGLFPSAQAWRNYPGRRKAGWIAAGIVLLLHVAGLIGWTLLSDYQRDPTMAAPDLITYLNAGDALAQRQPLYLLARWTESTFNYRYHPLIALLLSLVSALPLRLLALAGIFINIACYVAAWSTFIRLLTEHRQTHLAATARAWFPAVVTASTFISQLYYLNITPILSLVAVLLMRALLRQQWSLAALLTLPLLLTKPHWMFPLIIPLVNRQWIGLLKVIVGACIAYIGATLIYIVLVGQNYAISTLRDYATFLTHASDYYPWEGKSATFVELNHSWKQTIYHYFGFTAWADTATLALKLGLIAGFGTVILLVWNSAKGRTVDLYTTLVCSWLGYLVAMGILDELFEISAGVFLFVLLCASQHRLIRQAALVFLIYIWFEIAILLSFIPGLGWLNLHAYLPITLLALLLLYVLSLLQIYQSVRQPAAHGELSQPIQP